MRSQPLKLNYVNNYLRAGPSTIQRFFIFDPKVALPASIHINGNFMVGRPEVCADNWKGVDAGLKVPSRRPVVHQELFAAERRSLGIC